MAKEFNIEALENFFHKKANVQILIEDSTLFADFIFSTDFYLEVLAFKNPGNKPENPRFYDQEEIPF